MKKKFSGPQIVTKLRQTDILIGQGKKIPEVCKEIDVSENTYDPGALEPGKTYYWRVDESDCVDTYKGDIWNFKVVTPILVDN